MRFDRKKYWEKKILPWESSRYGGSALLRPGSWTLRRRMRMAVRVASAALPRGGTLLELGCGSGLFASRMAGAFGAYHGIDLAEVAVREARARAPAGAVFMQGDVLEAPLPEADLAVFLGLLDWLEPAEAQLLLARVPAGRLLFSFTDDGAQASPVSLYGLYRAWYDQRFGAGMYKARAYSWEKIRSWLAPLGEHTATLYPAPFFDPGRLVLVEKLSHVRA